MKTVLFIVFMLVIIVVLRYLYKSGKDTSVRRLAHYQARNMSDEALVERQKILKLHSTLSPDEEIELEEIEIEIKHREDIRNRSR